MDKDIVRCLFYSGCNAKDFCIHAKEHEVKEYQRNDFMTDKCTDKFICPYYEVETFCQRIGRSKHESLPV